jgi:hypothetical protein
MALPISIPNTFATETTNIPLSDLDANFTTVANAINGIGSGSEALANVAITGGTMTNVTANAVSISNATITGGTITGITPIAVVVGGTGSNTAAGARTNLSAAASGANSDITALSGLTTALSVGQGGTGLANLTANSVLIGNGTSAVNLVAPGTSGNLLTSNGTAWTSAVAPTGITATTGSAPYFGARAWVSFAGATGTIGASGNIASVSRASAGVYTVTFTTAMPDTNYTVSVTPFLTTLGSPFQMAFCTNKSTASFEVKTGEYTGTSNNLTLIDMTSVSCVVIR